MADFQDQRAYLKQPAIFQNSKRALAALGKKRSGAKIEATVKGAAVTEVVSKSRDLKIPRYVRNVGLGFKTPASAISGAYIDKKCPFTGSVSARKPADSEYFYSPLAISVALNFPCRSLFAAEFCVVLLCPPRCSALSFFAETTCTTSRSTIGTRRGTRTSQLTSPLASSCQWATASLLVNAGAPGFCFDSTLCTTCNRL
jgi:hypothetical protein